MNKDVDSSKNDFKVFASKMFSLFGVSKTREVSFIIPNLFFFFFIFTSSPLFFIKVTYIRDGKIVVTKL